MEFNGQNMDWGSFPTGPVSTACMVTVKDLQMDYFEISV